MTDFLFKINLAFFFGKLMFVDKHNFTSLPPNQDIHKLRVLLRPSSAPTILGWQWVFPIFPRPAGPVVPAVQFGETLFARSPSGFGFLVGRRPPPPPEPAPYHPVPPPPQVGKGLCPNSRGDGGGA